MCYNENKKSARRTKFNNMKREKITIQDIADSLGISRNTVSKALNGQYVPPHTRERVLNAAIELGYKSYHAVASESDDPHRRIVLITSKMLMTMTFFIHVVRGIESALAEDENVELLQFTTTKTSFFERLVDYLNENKVDGIICMELFQADYVPKLIELGYPTVFFDFPIYVSPTGNYDIVLPESFAPVKNYCLTLIGEQDCKTFGFVGDYTHCTSFYERFLAMREAIFLSGLTYDPKCSVIEKDSFPYGNPTELARLFAQMPALPDCFVAANDTLAISVIEALKKLHKKVPRDVLVVGFDNLAEAKSHDPQLTTFNIDKTGLGRKLLSVLLDRIAHPRQKTQTIYLQSKLIVRQTT